jgi:hypothetical protein
VYGICTVYIKLDNNIELIRKVTDLGSIYIGGIGEITGSAGSTYAGSFANTYDNNIETFWNSGKYSGTLTYNFSRLVRIGKIIVYIAPNPSTKVTINVQGLQDGNWVSIGTTTVQVPNTLTPVEVVVNRDLYKGLKLEISTPSAWTQIHEVYIQ